MKYACKSLFAIGAILSSAAFAQSADSPIAGFEKMFDTFALKTKKTSTGDRIQPIGLQVSLEADVAGAKYVENLNTKKGMILYIDYSGISVGQEWAMPPMKEIVVPLHEQCAAAGGTVKQLKEYRYAGAQRLALNNTNEAFSNAKMVGKYRCDLGSGQAYVLDVKASSQYVGGTFLGVGKSEWPIHVGYLSPDQVAEFEQRAKEYGAKVDELRKSPAGKPVQVRVTALPPNTFRDIVSEKRAVGDMYVCAQVIDVKPPMAHVQIRTQTLFVPIDTLYPQGKPMPAYSASSASMPLTACAQ